VLGRAVYRLSPRDREFTATESKKKADVVKYQVVFDHVGLRVNEPPGPAGLPFN
jgi:hypothetical protein